MKFMIEMDKSK